MFLLDCCSSINLTLGNSIKEADYTYQAYEDVYTFSGIINDMDYYVDSKGEHAIWNVVYENDYSIWIIGKKTLLGSAYGSISAGSSKLKNKCPNNEGYIWSWKYLNYIDFEYSWTATDDIYLKCTTEDDFCTSENPCGPDQGDCDTNDECQFGLTCGTNNCPDSLGIDSDMDCCYIKCLENWIGDIFCDDANNYKECNWDGGDCCGEYVINGYCEFCQCHDLNDELSINTTTLSSTHLSTN